MKYFDLLTSKNLKKRLNLSFYEQLFLKYIKSISKIPSEYQEVEYIEGTGTQYIDLNFTPTSETKYYVKIKFTSSNTLSYIISANDSENRNNIYITNTGKISSGYGSNYNNTNQTVINNKTYRLILDKNKFYINNILFYTYEEQEFENTVNCVLFARNNNNSITSYSNIKLYRCKIYENEELIRDLIPCYKKSNAEIGLYDLVNDVFYTNAGTDEFLKGDNI